MEFSQEDLDLLNAVIYDSNPRQPSGNPKRPRGTGGGSGPSGKSAALLDGMFPFFTLKKFGGLGRNAKRKSNFNKQKETCCQNSRPCC